MRYGFQYISKSIYDDENNSEQEMKSYLWKSVGSSEWVITMHSNVDKYIESRHIEVCVTMNMRF